MAPLMNGSELLDELACVQQGKEAANEEPQPGWPASLFDRYFVAWGERAYRSWLQRHPLSADGILRDPYV